MSTRTISLLCVALLPIGLLASEVNVWVVGSTRPFAQSTVDLPGEQGLISQVQTLFAQTLGTTRRFNVVFEDVARNKTLDTAYGGGGDLRSMNYQAHSLAQWFYWPEGRPERRAALRGEGPVKYEYVVLVGDPYIVEQLPGMYAEGVAVIAEEMRQGSAKPILLIPGSQRPSNSLIPVAEVVTRVGRSGNIPVLPAAWVQWVRGQLDGAYEGVNPFAMKQVTKREVTYNHTGTSSERGIEGALKAVTQQAGVRLQKREPGQADGRIDFNYGRGNSNFEANKRYKVDPDAFGRSYGFPMQDHSKTAAETLLYGIDRRAFQNGGAEDGTDLGIAWDMIKDGEIEHDVRGIPIRLLWAKLHDLDPALPPLRDRWHMSHALDHASASFIYTLLSGRCPMGEPPAEQRGGAYAQWLGRKVGYETAWRMGRIEARAPGFTVRPVGKVEEVTSGQSVQLTVQFHFAPKSEVQVAVGVDQPNAARTEPGLLTFTPSNHAEPQTVTLTGAEISGSTPIRVMVRTRSGDPVFNGLQDQWSFRIKAP